MVFPLRIVPFEESLLVDDRPAYPWNIVVRLRFRGPLDQPAWNAAWAEAIERHPMLRAKLRRRGWSWQWTPVEPAVPPVAWNTHTAGTFPRMQRIDLMQRGPLEAWALSANDSSEFIVHFHHVNVDGLGAVQFLGDLLTLYANQLGGGHALPRLDPRQLRHRGRYGLTWWSFLKRARRLAIGVGGIREFLSRIAVPLTPHDIAADSAGLPEDYLTVLSHEFNVAETAAIVAAAKNAAATVNSLLARDLFLALGEWRSARQLSDDAAWLRVMVPMNLRGPDEIHTPAANIMSTVFLDRQPPDLQRPQELLTSIQDQMNLIRRNYLELIYVISLRAMAWIPGQIARTVAAQKSVATAIFTNLMRPFEQLPLPRNDHKLQLGPTTLEAFELFAPLRPGTCAAFSAMTYAQRLRICLHYDSRAISAPAARELLALFEQRLRTSAGV